jgi:hypothetical protein
VYVVVRAGLPFVRYVCYPGQTKKRWLIFLGLLAFTKILGMDPQEAKKLCDGAVAGTKNKNVHSFCP